MIAITDQHRLIVLKVPGKLSDTYFGYGFNWGELFASILLGFTQLIEIYVKISAPKPKPAFIIPASKPSRDGRYYHAR